MKEYSLEAMKKVLVVFLFLSHSLAFSQVKVYSNGNLEVYSQTSAWGKAISAIVTNSNACSYNLNYNNSDVFYVNAHGWLWAKLGGYFGSDIDLKKSVKDIDNPIQCCILCRVNRTILRMNQNDCDMDL